MKTTLRHNVRRAFTLTEMLVVVAIILVIASIAVASVIPFLKGRRLAAATRSIQAAVLRARGYAATNRTSATLKVFPGYDKLVVYETELAARTASSPDSHKGQRVMEPISVPEAINFWTGNGKGNYVPLGASPTPDGVVRLKTAADGFPAVQNGEPVLINSAPNSNATDRLVFHPSGSLDPDGMGGTTANWFIVVENQQGTKTAVEIIFSTGMIRIHQL